VRTTGWNIVGAACAATGIGTAALGVAGRVPEVLALETAGALAITAFAAAVGGIVAERHRKESEARGVPRAALEESEEIILLASDLSGHLRPLNRGGRQFLGVVEGSEGPHLSRLFPEAEASALLAEVESILENSRFLPARSRLLRDASGHTSEATVTLFRLSGSGSEAGLLILEPRGGPKRTEAGYRMLESCPAGLLRIDGAGFIESVSGTFAGWMGRPAESFTGMKVATLEVLPGPFRELLDRASRESGATSGLLEADFESLGSDGIHRPLHAFFSRDTGGILNVVLVDGTSRQRLVKERDSSREALAAARRGQGHGRSGQLQAVQTTPSVLLVEDNDENRDLLNHMVRTRGARVTACATGWQALEAARSQAFDMVLLDLQLPVMDGYEVAHQLRAMPGGVDLPIIALTAFTSERERERAQIEGFNEFVGKPVSLAVLGQLLKRWAPRPGE
jgi:CheY-like chemotaxis protein